MTNCFVCLETSSNIASDLCLDLNMLPYHKGQLYMNGLLSRANTCNLNMEKNDLRAMFLVQSKKQE